MNVVEAGDGVVAVGEPVALLLKLLDLLRVGVPPHHSRDAHAQPGDAIQLYQSDPSGNYNGWKATCIGANNQSANSLMKQEYKDEVIPLPQALGLAVKVLTKTCDSTVLTPDKFDLATLTRVDGKMVYHEFTAAEAQALLDLHKEDAASADA